MELRKHWRRWGRRDVGENVRLALAALRAHKLRSALTALGIFIAVITLTSVVALLAGFDRSVKQSIQSFGTNTAYFTHRQPGPRFARPSRAERMREPLSYEDYRAVREFCTACAGVTVFLRSRFGNRARYGSEEIVELDFRGANPEFFGVYANAVVERGRSFTEGENRHRARVAVLGYDIAKGLFAHEDPLGKQIVVNGRRFTVLGVMERPRGTLGPGGGDDRRVVVPYGTFHKLYPQDDEHGIRIEAYPNRLPEAIDQTRVALRLSRGVPYDEPDDFHYITAEAAIERFHQIVGVVALVIAVVASIGLLVGGVGVMNIMLVSVTERTREIGIRKAVGARRRDVVWQFLTEAVALTASAGVLGVAISYGISAAIRHHAQGLPSYVPFWVVALALGAAVSVGLFFGLYPAVKAARLDPVDALRYE